MKMHVQFSDDSAETAPLYRPAKALPIELQEQCAIYLEEGLYSQALTLLTSLLISGTSCSSDNHHVPAYVPPPSFLAFLATLVVHPNTTTRARSDDRMIAANQALQYLQNLCDIVGPINARLASAFTFPSNSRGRISLGKRRRGNDNAVEDNYSNDQILDTRLAREQSVWTRCESFWHVVGGAFNCSVSSEKRWQRWKLWLDFMLNVLEADLLARSAQARTMQNEEEKQALIAGSLAAQFATGSDSSISHHERRRAMRAVFAHASSKDVAEFKEIWKDETKENGTKDEGTRPQPGEFRQGLDSLESDDEESMEVMSSDLIGATAETPVSARQTRQKSTQSHKPAAEDSDEPAEDIMQNAEDPIVSCGGLEAVYLRRRILRLLCRLCEVSTVFATTEILLDLFSEFCRPLPVSVFSVILMPSGSYALPPTYNCSLCKELFQPLLAITAPSIDTYQVDQEDMEDRYLTATANSSTADDNAKVSILMEAILWLLRNDDALEYSEKLKDAVEHGIRARQDRVKQAKSGTKKGSKKQNNVESEHGLEWLNASSRRLELFVELLRS